MLPPPPDTTCRLLFCTPALVYARAIERRGCPSFGGAQRVRKDTLYPTTKYETRVPAFHFNRSVLKLLPRQRELAVVMATGPPFLLFYLPQLGVSDAKKVYLGCVVCAAVCANVVTELECDAML